VPLTQLDDALFAGLSELKTVSGVLALIAVPQYDIHPQNSHFCLLLENIQDPGNLGSMLRSAAAAGCDAVFMSRGCADACRQSFARIHGGAFVLDLHEHADLLGVAGVFPGTIYAASLSARTSLYAASCVADSVCYRQRRSRLSQELLVNTIPVTIPMPGK